MILTVCVMMTGCQQANSFMHMNSDSPSPFFGLQLAVDRDTPSVTVPRTTTNLQLDSATEPSGDFFLTRATAASADEASASSPAESRFSFTGGDAETQGDLVRALPQAKPQAGSSEANQLADLLARLKRS